MVKYPLWIQKNYYIIRYNIRAAAILIFDKISISPRQTTATARRLSAYMSSTALATTTASSFSYFYCISEYFWLINVFIKHATIRTYVYSSL